MLYVQRLRECVCRASYSSYAYTVSSCPSPSYMHIYACTHTHAHTRTHACTHTHWSPASVASSPKSITKGAMHLIASRATFCNLLHAKLW